MARYTDDSIERVRQTVDMLDLVAAKTELKRSGQQWMGCCPFHDERSPSFSLNAADKVFHCFGCGEGGDLFRFVELTEGLPFREALEYLADRYNVTIELADEDPRAAERRFVMGPIAEIAPDWVHPVLGQTAQALFGCASIGIDAEPITPKA